MGVQAARQGLVQHLACQVEGEAHCLYQQQLPPSLLDLWRRHLSWPQACQAGRSYHGCFWLEGLYPDWSWEKGRSDSSPLCWVGLAASGGCVMVVGCQREPSS